MFCTDFGRDDQGSDTQWRERILGDLVVAMGDTLNPSRYLENPGAVPGHNMYTVHANEVDQFVALNNFLQDLYTSVYRDAPRNTTSDRAMKGIVGAMTAASARAKKHFSTPGSASVPLFVVDGPIDKGGPEASEYLTIVRATQANYSKLQRVYYETRVGMQAMKQAQIDAPKWFAMIGHMAMHGTIGKGKSEGYDRWRRGQKP